MKREFRFLPKAQLRASAAKIRGIEGYAAVFNELSDPLQWGIREIIMPGAFKDCLATSPDVRCLFNHDSNLVLGRTKAKTLSLEEDTKGLRFNCDLPDTQMARDLVTSIGRGDVDQCSFGFYVRKEKWSEETDDNGQTQVIRELHAVDLFDVSPVTFPAYPQTSVDTRTLWPDGIPHSIERMRADRRDDEKHAANEAGCDCDCAECDADNCADCSNPECDDANCDHATRGTRVIVARADAALIDEETRERMRMVLALTTQ
jgi:Escherichia/Staphylococcus phage prohead protease